MTAPSTSRLRVRWAAIGAAIAVTFGAGTIASVDAARSSGERASYFPITPCRLADTRPEPEFNVGGRTWPLQSGETATFTARGVVGQCTASDLPNDASALQLNITPTRPSEETYLTIWPDGARPTASSLNPAPGESPTPNAVTTPLSASGEFNVFNNVGTVHVVIDVVGFYADHDHDDRYAPRVQRLIVDSAAFNPGDAGDELNIGKIQGAYYDTAGSVNQVATAPLLLPVGATITEVTFHYFDDAPGADLNLGITRSPVASNSSGFLSGAFTSTSGSSGVPRSTTLSPNAVVPGDASLALIAYTSNWHTVGSNLGIKAVEIAYTLPEA